MNLVFDLDNVICTPNADLLACRPIANAVSFMQWCKKRGHHITIWSQRLNDMEVRTKTLRWLELEQIPFDRMLFNKPRNPIYVEETPSNAKYHQSESDNDVIAMLFEEWKKDVGE